MEEKLSDIVGRRSTPAIIILDGEDQLLYCNQEALDMFPQLRQGRRRSRPPLPPEIFDLCRELRAKKGERRPGTCGRLLNKSTYPPSSARAFFLGQQDEHEPTHIMVLIEKVTRGRAIDFQRVKKQFVLSSRELQVLTLLCQGLSNKDIAANLCISEYTAKDHIKKIMRKLGMTSRSQIISFLSR